MTNTPSEQAAASQPLIAVLDCHQIDMAARIAAIDDLVRACDGQLVQDDVSATCTVLRLCIPPEASARVRAALALGGALILPFAGSDSGDVCTVVVAATTS